MVVLRPTCRQLSRTDRASPYWRGPSGPRRVPSWCDGHGAGMVFPVVSQMLPDQLLPDEAGLK